MSSRWWNGYGAIAKEASHLTRLPAIPIRSECALISIIPTRRDSSTSASEISSRNVSVLHDYGLYEFTILVRRDEEVAL